MQCIRKRKVNKWISLIRLWDFWRWQQGIEGRERSGGGSQERAQHRGIWLTIPTIPNTIPRAPWITLRSTIESMRDTGRLTLWPSLGIPGTQLWAFASFPHRLPFFLVQHHTPPKIPPICLLQIVPSLQIPSAVAQYAPHSPAELLHLKRTQVFDKIQKIGALQDEGWVLSGLGHIGGETQGAYTRAHIGPHLVDLRDQQEFSISKIHHGKCIVYCRQAPTSTRGYSTTQFSNYYSYPTRKILLLDRLVE